jgi:hypothetical protein
MAIYCYRIWRAKDCCYATSEEHQVTASDAEYVVEFQRCWHSFRPRTTSNLKSKLVLVLKAFGTLVPITTLAL